MSLWGCVKMAVMLTICFSVMILNAVPYSAYGVLYAPKGQHFQTIIKKDEFFGQENNIKFTVSIDGMPDLPMWLKFEQKDPLDDGILYGTPKDDDVNIGLKIIAWNKETYDTLDKAIIVAVTGKAPNITHPIELRIKNKDVTDMMKSNGHFLQTVNKIWSGAKYITNVERPIHRVGLDQSAFKFEYGKESVFIGVGGNSEYPKELMSLKSECGSVPPTNKIQKAFMDSGYDIDWCSFKNLNEDPSLTPKFKFDKNSNFFDADLKTRKFDLQRADLTMDIIYVFIAVFVGLVLIIFLTCLMCFNREGLQHRNKLTPKEQLLHHKALRRAGAQLRNMSGKDEGNKVFPYGKLDEDSKFGTLSSNKPPTELESSPSPPPYRHGNDRVKRQDSKF